MQITYKFLGTGVERIVFGTEGHFQRTKAAAWSRDANTFNNTVPAELFAKVAAFCGGGSDDENLFANLRRFAAGYQPEGMSAKSTKARRTEQAANVKAFAAAFAN